MIEIGSGCVTADHYGECVRSVGAGVADENLQVFRSLRDGRYIYTRAMDV